MLTRLPAKQIDLGLTQISFSAYATDTTMNATRNRGEVSILRDGITRQYGWWYDGKHVFFENEPLLIANIGRGPQTDRLRQVLEKAVQGARSEARQSTLVAA